MAGIPFKYSEPPCSEVKLLIKDFILILNDNIKKQVPDFHNKNSGWDECIPDIKIKSGWDEAQEALGLPTSLYEDPAKKSFIQLKSIKCTQKYETEDEIKYIIDFIIQKINVDDQMIIKGHFVQDKKPLHDENNFFNNQKVNIRIIIEDLFIIGYLSKEGPESHLISDGDSKEKYFDYDKLETNQILDPQYIQKILMKKYKQQNRETSLRKAMLYDEN